HPVDPALERPGVLHGPGVQQVGALGHAHGGGAAGVDGDLVPAALALAGVPGEVGEVLGGGPAVGADVPDRHVVGLGLAQHRGRGAHGLPAAGGDDVRPVGAVRAAA